MLSKNDAFSSFSVDSLEEAKAFYGNVLGLDSTENSDMGLLNLHVSKGTEVMIYPKGSDHKPANFTVLNFVVDNIEETVNELSGLGIQFEQYSGEIKTDAKGIARGGGSLIAWFKDPAGNILSIIEAT